MIFKLDRFEFDKFSLVIGIAGVGKSLTNGLVLEDSFLSIVKDKQDLVRFKSGIGGEKLVIKPIKNRVSYLKLKYLPTTSVFQTFDLLDTLDIQFPVTIENKSNPRYKGFASECYLMKKHSIEIGVKGFKDGEYTILMTDYVEVAL